MVQAIRRSLGLAGSSPLLILLGLIALASSARAHPTDSELLDGIEERRRCEWNLAEADRSDPVRLMMSRAELQAAVTGLRQDPPPSDSDSEADDPDRRLRFVREATGDLARVEYELWNDRVYRIRWRLSAAFERPVMDEFNRRGRICFGTPRFDQLFDAEPGSSKATLRRISWDHGEYRIELRQLHPLRGGPTYLTVTATSLLRQLGSLGLASFPDPDRTASWWRRPSKMLTPATDEERLRLGQAFTRVLSQLDH